jgi:hypothetical protein
VNDAERLKELEKQWQAEFIQQPKLPTFALLSGAVSMALGFGGVLFVLFVQYRHLAWIFFVSSLIVGILGWRIASNWYRNEVIPWDARRRETAVQIQQLKERLQGTSV